MYVRYSAVGIQEGDSVPKVIYPAGYQRTAEISPKHTAYYIKENGDSVSNLFIHLSASSQSKNDIHGGI